MMTDSQLSKALFDLIVRTSTELPQDVIAGIRRAFSQEAAGTPAALTLSLFLKNLELAKEKRAPACQDTGMPLFFVRHPAETDGKLVINAVSDALVRATKEQYLRPNAVDPLTGENSGTNLGKGLPAVYFEERNDKTMEVSLILKGGGSENVGRQYSLPHDELNAGRDLEGVRKVVLDAVYRAEGRACPPGILGICIGGDRGSGYTESKKQFLRKLDDHNTDPVLRDLEERILRDANELGIGPLGLGGKTTLLGVKIGTLHRIPASYFVTVSYMCWEYRRRVLRIEPDGTCEVL